MVGAAAVIALGLVLLFGMRQLLSQPRPSARSISPVSPAVAQPSIEPTPTAVPRDPRLVPADALSPELLVGDAPKFVSIAIPTDEGGAFIAGNVGLAFPSSALAGLDGPVQVTVERRPQTLPIPVAPWRVSSQGTIFELTVKDRNGKQITTFPAPITILFQYSNTDLSMADGNANILTAGFVIDSHSPAIANPTHFPVGTWVFFPASTTRLDTAQRAIRVRTQAAPTVLGLMTRPYAQVKVLAQQTGLYSNFSLTGKLFGTRPAGSVLDVAGPQVGNRLIVFDPETQNYAYVNAADVGP